MPSSATAAARRYRLGDRVTVRLVEAAPVAGALRFELLSEGRYNNASRRRTRPRGPQASGSKARERGSVHARARAQRAATGNDANDE